MKERERLLTAKTGEGILIISNEHSEIKIIASPKEHAVITTNADEKLAQERAKANDVVTSFEKALDYTKGYFRKKELKQHEVEDLLKQGYIVSACIGLFGGRQEEYVLKPRYNESVDHFFVIKAIEEYLKKYTEKVELLVSSNADIIFEHNGVKVAIEVETGKQHYSKVEEKVKLLKKRFGTNWFFVVTDWKEKENYAKYGITLVRKEVPAVLKKQYFSRGSNFADTASENAENARSEVQKPFLLNASSVEALNIKTEVHDNGTEK